MNAFLEFVLSAAAWLFGFVHFDVSASGQQDLGLIRASVLLSATTDKRVHLEKVATIRIPPPALAADHAKVMVAASSVNPVNWKFPFLMPDPSWTYPKVLLSDLAGKVLEVGIDPSCQHLHQGAPVWGMMGLADGAAAEIVSAPCRSLGLAPEALPLKEAAVLPLVALTGLQGLRWAGGPSFLTGKTVLVLGGSGGTGHTGIQLAKAMGAARVITTCSAANVGMVQELGADQAIDYHAQKWQDVLPPQSIDVVYDCVCQDGTGDLAYPLLKEGGRFVTLLPGALAKPETAAARPGVQQSFFLLNQTSSKELDMLRAFADQGKLRGVISRTFPLESMREALNTSIAGHVVGKIAVEVASAEVVTI